MTLENITEIRLNHLCEGVSDGLFYVVPTHCSQWQVSPVVLPSLQIIGATVASQAYNCALRILGAFFPLLKCLCLGKSDKKPGLLVKWPIWLGMQTLCLAATVAADFCTRNHSCLQGFFLIALWSQHPIERQDLSFFPWNWKWLGTHLFITVQLWHLL